MFRRFFGRGSRQAPSQPSIAVIPTVQPSIAVEGVRVRPESGQVERSQLEPVGRAVELGSDVAEIVREADQCLDLDVINTQFNPFRDEPRRPDRQPIEGPYARPREIYRARAFVPVRGLIAQALPQFGFDQATIGTLVPALSEFGVLRTHAHQFALPTGPGNRIVFYGGDVGHTHIDRLVHEVGKQHMRVLKLMVHFNAGARGGEGSQGGTPEEIISERVGGSTHVGGFSAGWSEGSPVSAKSDWPSDYGRLSDSGEVYNAHLLAIDYGAGTYRPIPEPMLAAYKQNADMWDCCAGMLVPFAGGDPDPRFTNYQYNPLDVYDQASARDLAQSLATLDRDVFLGKHGAFYCAEGQYCVANLGPQEDSSGGTLLKRSRYGDSAFGGVIENFAKAPDYANMPLEEQRKRPEIGWKHLLSLGAQNGGISEEQHDHLKRTDRTAIFLEWIPESVQGWQAFKPRNEEGLVAKPMTVATLAWSLFRRYLPREGIARILAEDVTRAHASGNENIKHAVQMLCGGKDPTTPQGQMSLVGVAAKIASGLLITVLASDDLRQNLLMQAGYEEIPTDRDRKKVQAVYDKFLALLKSADYSSQESFDRALREADAECARLQVERTHINFFTKTYKRAPGSPMLYAAPSCYAMWAQQPAFAETGCIRYVATAMHVKQRKAAQPANS